VQQLGSLQGYDQSGGRGERRGAMAGGWRGLAKQWGHSLGSAHWQSHGELLNSQHLDNAGRPRRDHQQRRYHDPDWHYVQQVGSLQVTLAPAGAISAGAQWRVDGGAWQNSGATVSSLIVGSHTVNFQTVSTWTTPLTKA